jgi:hypothetical protein
MQEITHTTMCPMKASSQLEIGPLDEVLMTWLQFDLTETMRTSETIKATEDRTTLTPTSAFRARADRSMNPSLRRTSWTM